MKDLPWQPNPPSADHTARELAMLALITGAMLALLSFLPATFSATFSDKGPRPWAVAPTPAREEQTPMEEHS